MAAYGGRGQNMSYTAASHAFPCETCPVRDQAICSVLTNDELKELNAITTAVNLSSNGVVFYEEDENTYLFNVVSGAVRLVKLLPDGRRQVTGFLFPGDFLGLSIADTYAYSAEALTRTSLCRFDRAKLVKLLERFPKLEHRLLELASNELAEAQAQMLMLGRKTATERLASTIIRLSERIGRPSNDGTIIELPMKREDLADYTGLTTETVSRTFTEFRDDGVLGLRDARHIHVTEPEKLAAIAGD